MARKQLNHTIPKGWKYDLLDTFTNRRSGHTPSQSHPEYWNGGIKWVSLADSSQLDNGFIYDTVKEISNLGLDNSSAELHPENTVIMARDAGIGKSAILFSEMAVSQHFIAWRCSPETISSWFLYNWLQFYKIEFERQAVGSTIKTIGLPFFKKLKIALPPIQEQQKIAEILSTWDKAITNTENLIANSEMQKKALMQQLLTGKKRLLDENGVRFSEEWESENLGSIAKIITGSSNRQDSLDEGLYAFFDRSSEIRRSNQYLFDEEAIIVAGEGQEFVPKYFIGKFDLHQRTYAIIKTTNEYDYKFLYYLITFNNHYFLSQAVGSTVKSLRLPMFEKMPLNIPQLQEQEKIAKVLSNTDREIELLREKLKHFKQEKKALMQQLLTGKRRVKGE